MAVLRHPIDMSRCKNAMRRKPAHSGTALRAADRDVLSTLKAQCRRAWARKI